jgi:hypothetical protein
VSRRFIGSALGVLIGLGLVIYLDEHNIFSKRRRPRSATPAPPTATAPPVRDPVVARLRREMESQAEEIARLERARQAGEALALLTVPRSPVDLTQTEMARLHALPEKELDDEITDAVEETAGYIEKGRYSQKSHAELYRHINEFFDMPGLTEPQNDSLSRAVKELNDLVVQHVEEAAESGNDDEVIRTVAGLGPWAFRLTPEQEKPLIEAAQAVKARLAD